MTRDEIIEMARRAGARDDGWKFEFPEPHYIERFASFVAGREAAKWISGAKLSVPTLGMEQAFDWHHKQGYKAGINTGLTLAAEALDRQADIAADDHDRKWAKQMAAAVRAMRTQP